MAKLLNYFHITTICHDIILRGTIYFALTKAVRGGAVIIGAVIGIALWAIAKPILRGIGWLISILSAIGAIYWLLTL